LRENRGVSNTACPLLPPVGGKNMPEAGRDSAAPTAASGRGVQDLGGWKSDPMLARASQISHPDEADDLIRFLGLSMSE
jgi:hypothetical protein